jgi:4'-phosphopantetheinyl transferase
MIPADRSLLTVRCGSPGPWAPDTGDEPLTAASGEIHLWRADLRSLRPDGARTLARDEREQAERFLSAEARERYIRGRAWLRAVLARYLDVRPEEVRLVYGPYGKPHLDPSLQPSDLAFNLSHTGNCVLLGVTAGRRIGVDVERVRSDLEVSAILPCYFTAEEVTSLERLPASQRLPGFFQLWTRKEALLKAIGTGLTTALEIPAVPLREAVWECALRLPGWRGWSLDMAPGVPGAVVVELRDDDPGIG